MSKSHSIIEPFPAHIDRRDFGNWLSGFVDGEATFGLSIVRRENRFAHLSFFRITLRDDDAESLKLIQSYWRCGAIYFRKRPTSGSKPIVTYVVCTTPDLKNIVMPHFERFPLRAKKRNDFVIWRQGVELMAAIHARRIRAGRVGARFTGCVSKWSDAERQEFASLSDDLKARRRYPASNEPASPPPESELPDEQGLLF